MTKSALSSSRFGRKRNNIFASAREVFVREGFAQAGMEEVARGAGVSTATLYAHFPSKADLFRVVVEDTIDDIISAVRHSGDDPGDARRRLTAFGRAYAAFYCTPVSRAVFRMVIAERRRFPTLADHFQERGRTELGGTLIAILKQLDAAGEIEIFKPSWAAGHFQGMIEHSTLLLGMMAGDEVMPARPLDDIVEDAVDTFLARYGVRDKGG
ncbi:MAG: TetR/AcrR family transcriptional regulator [Caulobacter sp.]|nr:TetR/AcrR family transcriptional regulator [Caulobacter sp.]